MNEEQKFPCEELADRLNELLDEVSDINVRFDLLKEKIKAVADVAKQSDTFADLSYCRDCDTYFDSLHCLCICVVEPADEDLEDEATDMAIDNAKGSL